MSDDTDPRNDTGDAGNVSPRRRSPLWRLAKWLLLSVAGVVALLLVVTGVAVAYLSPDRLTPMVNRYASQYLIADVEAARVELSLWSTFPRLELRVDSLRIDSRALDCLADSQLASLPSDAARLLEVERFRGAVNLPAILKGQFRLHDVIIYNPDINLVTVNDSVANYLIVPPSDDDGSVTIIPDITIDRFAVTGDAPIRYFSLADSTIVDARVVASLTHDASGVPVYTISTSGSGRGDMGRGLSIAEMTFGVDGRVNWSASDPWRIALDNFIITLDRFTFGIEAVMDFADNLKVHSFKLTAEDINLGELIGHVPEKWRGELDRLSTDLEVDITASLTSPYVPAVDSIPSAVIDLKAAGTLDYDRLKLQDIDADLTAEINGAAPDESTLTLRRLRVIGRAMGFELDGEVTRPFSDPHIKGSFKGGINFSALPRRLCERLGIEMTGLLTGDARFNFNLSHLTPRDFHRVRIDGDMRLKRFTAQMLDSSMNLYATGARLRFGTSSTVKMAANSADSLLTVGFTADTLAAGFNDGVVIGASAVQLGLAAKNVPSSFDTTQINPLGARFTAERVMLRSAIDTMTVRLSKVLAAASIRRYKGNRHVPQMHMRLEANRLRFTNPFNRASLRGSRFDIDMHLREADTLAARRRAARRDSLRALYPDISDDSLRSVMRASVRKRRAADSLAITDGRAFDFDVDRSFARLLRRLDVHGSLSVDTGRLMTQFFPLRTRISSVGLRFTTDSVAIDSARVRLGESSMSLTGRITNIARAVTSVRQPMRVKFDIDADTVNINEIAEGVFAGSDFAAHLASRQRLTDGESDSDIEASLARQTDASAKTAVIIPSNLDAELSLRAGNVLYSDIWFQRIDGRIAVHDGALHLDRLGGYTPIGSMSLTALYQAPDYENLRFAAGAVIRRLQLKRFLNLMPDIDSLMPILRDINGIVTAELAMTTDLDSLLDIKFHTLDAFMRLSGDSLQLVDEHTFRTMAKWLRFKHRDHPVIDHMTAEIMVRDSRLDLFPFVFDFDRYRIGVSGHNDMGLNLDYHIAVLKSPLPFKFGINIKGRPGHLRFSLGRAHFNENRVAEQRQLTDTVRVNLLDEISRAFRYGVSSGKQNARLARMQRPDSAEFAVPDTLSRADSLLFIREGIIELPDTLTPPVPASSISRK